tara:strand:+ start:2286 stop:3263 length:978 start_codon:yes stop_codon:yes gene_type:complete
MNGKVILIFGGTGSLGKELNKRYLNDNTIFNFSRDEHKHWLMKIQFNNNPNLNFIIGNVSDKYKVQETICRVKPHIIIIASAMKHIDQCELNTSESLNTNLIGTKNILDSIENINNNVHNIETVLFVSSDKACSPINNYGLCKALSETLIVEKAHFIKNIKFINIRYGNVLNSTGSIIPRLHEIGKDDNYDHFTLTHTNMTRFVMTLEQSVDLIEHALLNGKTGETVVSELYSMRVEDLIQIFSEIYNKPIKNTGLRPGEKLLESLINRTQSGRIIENGKYKHIQSVISYTKNINPDELTDFNSNINPFSKDELKKYLYDLKLLN